MSTSLAEIERQKIAVNAEIAEELKRHAEAMKGLASRKLRLDEQSCTVVSGLDLATVNLAEHVIEVSGWLRGGEGRKLELEKAVTDLVSGANTLRGHFYGTKNYDRWSGQGIGPCPYGCGPRHGNTVFSIGLTREARTRELLPEEIDAAIYYLRNIQQISEAKVEARKATT